MSTPDAPAGHAPGGRASAGHAPAPGAPAALGRVIRRERLARGWGLKRLASGVCAVSYLSKIERGEAEPSREVAGALTARLGISWHDDEAFLARSRRLLGRCREAVLSCEEASFPGLAAELADQADALAASPLAAEAALMAACLAGPDAAPAPVDAELEVLLDERGLALQRLLQGRMEEALRLWPCPLTYLRAGTAAYGRGEKNYVDALAHLRRAADLAAAEGRARVMLLARLCAGNCLSNQLDLAGMEAEYEVAARLARSLGEKDLLRSISYNRASTRLECGRYREAYGYFHELEDPDAMDLHKLAVCCEGLGLRDEALGALARVCTDDDLVAQMCSVVRMRLEYADYLRRPEYGRELLGVFERLRAERPIGYAAFHLPWVLEWLTANRQYRAAYELARDFPLKVPPATGEHGAVAAVEYDGLDGV